MKTELTLNVLQTMSAQEYEDIRAAGSDERRELTHAVMRELDAPDNWMMNGEYGSEFGGFFPSVFVSRQPTNVSTGVMFTGRCLSGLGAGSGECRW